MFELEQFLGGGMFKKIFTIPEANKQLPYVKKIVGEILEKGSKLRKLLAANQSNEVSPQCQALGEKIEDLMAELEDLGCFYKDWNFEIGLVDFPVIIEGEETLLCWRSDEPEILWYHGMEDGYAGRRPLPAEWLLRDVFKK